MSDNTNLLDKDGATIAVSSDVIGGVTHPRVKVQWGADGTSVDASAANPLPTVQTGALPAGTNNIGDVDILTLVPGTGATNLGKAEDAAHTTGDVGVMLLAVRNDAGTVLAGTTGDYIPLSVDADGFLRVNVAGGELTLSGEDHIGQVGGHVTILTPAFTMDTTPDYAAGDVYGDKTTLTGAVRVSSGSGVLHSVLVVDADNVSPAFDILLFDSDPTGNTFTDNSALPTLVTGTIGKLLGRVRVAAADYVTVGGVAMQAISNIGLAVRANGSANLFVVLVAQASINVATASALTIRFAFLVD